MLQRENNCSPLSQKSHLFHSWVYWYPFVYFFHWAKYFVIVRKSSYLTNQWIHFSAITIHLIYVCNDDTDFLLPAKMKISTIAINKNLIGLRTKPIYIKMYVIIFWRRRRKHDMCISDAATILTLQERIELYESLSKM